MTYIRLDFLREYFYGIINGKYDNEINPEYLRAFMFYFNEKNERIDDAVKYILENMDIYKECPQVLLEILTGVNMNIKELEENYKEISREEALELQSETEFYIYNPLTDSIKTEFSNPLDIPHNKYAYEKLRYFVKGVYDEEK